MSIMQDNWLLIQYICTSVLCETSICGSSLLRIFHLMGRHCDIPYQLSGVVHCSLGYGMFLKGQCR